jgi:GGDEF domain-containing protein
VAAEEPRGARIETPYLQLVMQRLWEVERARGSSLLRLATFEELGGAARIVEDHLERALERLSPPEQSTAAAMFTYLVTPSGTKIAHSAGDLARYAGVAPATVESVARPLADERILRPLPAAETGGARYEIFHDVLADAVLAWRTRFAAAVELERERSAARRRHRRSLVVLAFSLVALAAMTTVAVYALAKRSEAREQAARAVAAREFAQRQAVIARRRSVQARASAVTAQEARDDARRQEGRAKSARREADRQAAIAENERDVARTQAARATRAKQDAQVAAAAARSSRADALAAAVAAEPQTAAGQPLLVSVSVGVAVFPTDGRTWEDLLAVADARMYQRKHRRVAAFPSVSG